MIRYIVLDSTPLGLLLQGKKYAQAEQCRIWIAEHLAQGTQIIVPEIVDYEVRRELLRLQKRAAIAELDIFNIAAPDRYLPLTTEAVQRAAQLWADSRRRGKPTSD